MLVVCLILVQMRQEVWAWRTVIYTRVPANSWLMSWNMIIGIYTLRVFSERTLHGPTLTWDIFEAPHERKALRWDFVLGLWEVYNPCHWLWFTYNIYSSDLEHHEANWVVLRLSPVCKSPTWLPPCLVVETAHATDVIEYRIHHISRCHAFYSAKGGKIPGR